MIILYISTNCNIDKKFLVNIFINKGVECSITENLSTVQHSSDQYECSFSNSMLSNPNCLKIELGFEIKMFNITNKVFKDHIWNDLSSKLNLRCAYIKTHNYMGCVLNWPDVFRKSACYYKL